MSVQPWPGTAQPRQVAAHLRLRGLCFLLLLGLRCLPAPARRSQARPSSGTPAAGAGAAPTSGRASRMSPRSPAPRRSLLGLPVLLALLGLQLLLLRRGELARAVLRQGLDCGRHGPGSARARRRARVGTGGGGRERARPGRPPGRRERAGDAWIGAPAVQPCGVTPCWRRRGPRCLEPVAPARHQRVVAPARPRPAQTRGRRPQGQSRACARPDGVRPRLHAVAGGRAADSQPADGRTQAGRQSVTGEAAAARLPAPHLRAARRAGRPGKPHTRGWACWPGCPAVARAAP